MLPKISLNIVVLSRIADWVAQMKARLFRYSAARRRRIENAAFSQRKLRARVTAPVFFLLTAIATMFSQGISAEEEGTLQGVSAEEEGTEVDMEPGSFVWAPVPLLGPSLGGGAVVVGMYFHPHQSDGPANVTGVAAGYTSTESYLVAAGHEHYFDGGRWKLEGGGGYAKANLNFYGIGAEAGDPGRSLDYTLDGTFLETRLWRNFSHGWAVGVSAQVTDASVDFEDSKPGDPIEDKLPGGDLDITSIGVGLMTEKDTRDNRFAAYTGHYVQASVTLFPGGLDNDVDFRIYKGSFNKYWSVTSSTVIATNVSTSYTDGDAPFYRLSKLNFRGVSGQTYWDKFLLQGQAEVRQQVYGNWSAALFAGYGGVSSSVNSFDSDDALLAGGAGIRYMVSQKQRLGLRVDVATGEDGAMLYISVGEAF